MQISNKYGKADLFMTFSANPGWQELQRMLLHDKSYLSHPDICARIYELKFKKWWSGITKEHRLGVVKAFVVVKELQKRGLPHHHCLIWLEDQDKPTSEDQFDDIICAELPDPAIDCELYDLVRTKMLHGPFRKNSACMQQFGNLCSTGFPNPFWNVTLIRPKQYPEYQRRETGITALVNGVELDNRYVIPYYRKLLRIFNCHINVEACGYLSTLKKICI